MRTDLNLDPGASGGIDMDSDLIEEMAADIPNLCGVKLTCGNVGKLTRIAATVSVPSFAQDHPRKNKDAPLGFPSRALLIFTHLLVVSSSWVVSSTSSFPRCTLMVTEQSLVSRMHIHTHYTHYGPPRTPLFHRVQTHQLRGYSMRNIFKALRHEQIELSP